MRNARLNRAIIKGIARQLGELNDRVVYVGGAVVSLYADDPAADDVRPTKDVDLTLEIASLSELEEIRLALVNKGFEQRAFEPVTCRFFYEDVMVDVMSTTEVGWAPANKWFAEGFNNAASSQ